MDAVLAVGEWPALMEVTDAQILSDFFLLNAENENYRNLIVYQCPMSSLFSLLLSVPPQAVSNAALKESAEIAAMIFLVFMFISYTDPFVFY